MARKSLELSRVLAATACPSSPRCWNESPLAEGGDHIMGFVSRGHGYLVLVFYAGALILTQLITDLIGGEGFYTAHAWPKYLAIGAGAVLFWVVGKWLNSGASKRLLDLETGEEFIMPAPRHDFFYVKIEHWGLIGAIGCVVLTVLSETGVIRF